MNLCQRAALAATLMIAVFCVDASAVERGHEFHSSISREVLNHHLSRAITMLGMISATRR